MGRRKVVMENLKRILIVDDSEIDREVLKSIFSDEFEVIETDNGYSALEIILKKKEHLDAIVLDVSMPVLDGLSVLRILRENNFEDAPVFMITAEATKDNVEKASQYKISEFIKKPFDRDEILRRLRLKLGVMAKQKLTETDIEETRKYISDLDAIYEKHLSFTGENNSHNERIADLMKIMLEKYMADTKGAELNEFQAEVISKAAYFCDIGNMLIPDTPAFKASKNDKTGNDVYQEHTVLGAGIIRLNYSENCRYFVQVCADMCLHHHERCDGTGFPHGISGNNISVYTQMCGLADRFDSLYFKYREHNELQFDFVISELAQDNGAVSREIFSLLTDSKADIVAYYNSNYM